MTLLGPSGSGKTTTLMMIAGFEIPTGGEIYIDSRPILGLPPHRRNIGMVFQNYALFPHMTVAENIGFPLKQRGVDKAAITAGVRAVLDTVRLSGLEARYPRQLSGGQQQRVARARDCLPPACLVDGRAAERARQAAARGIAARGQAAAQTARHHFRLCYP